MTDISENFQKKGIIKSDVSDHFTKFFSMQLKKEKLRQGVMKKKKRVFNKYKITSFRGKLSLLHRK